MVQNMLIFGWEPGLMCPPLDSMFQHIAHRSQDNFLDNTPPLYSYALDVINYVIDEGYINIHEIQTVTSKHLYDCHVKELKDPLIVTKYPQRDWNLIWTRLNKGIFSSFSRGILYLIIHQRVGTRERGHRLMPGRYPSPLCTRCASGEIENYMHRYTSCICLSQAWEWLRGIFISLDPMILICDDDDIISLNFTRGFRDNAILWCLGIYLEIVEREVVLKNQSLSIATLKGVLKQRKLLTKHQAILPLGSIPGVDFNPTGIG